MRVFLLILSIFLISYINSKDCEKVKEPSDLNDCKVAKLSGDQSHCCFAKISGAEVNTACVGLTNDEYKDIEKTIEEEEKKANIKIDSLDCKSYYLEFFLLSLLFLLL